MEGVYDVVVVGGGIMGLCTAFHLSKRGKSVLLLEQFDLLHHRGSSHGESRTLRLTYPEPYYTHMSNASLELWLEAQLEAGFEVFTKTGQLDFGHKDHLGLQKVIEACEKFKVGYQILDKGQLASKFDMVQLPEGYIAVHTQQAGVLRATKACAMFLALALKHGAVMRDNTKAEKISLTGDDSVLVSTTRGSVLARKCILACGAWIESVVKNSFGLTLPVQALQTYIAYWRVEDEAKSKFLAENGFPTFAIYDKKYFYGTPSLELPGLLKASIHGGNLCDPDERDLAPDVDELNKILSPWLKTAFKGLVRWEAPVIVEACMYSMTPDQDYILDFVPNTGKRVMVAGGFSGHGFKMGPLVGKIMSDLAVDGACEEAPLEYFSLARFEKSPLGNSKDFDPVQELSALSLEN